MARIPLVDPDDPGTDPRAREALAKMGTSVHPNVYRAMANHPEALEGFGAFGRVVYFANHLTPSERELAYLTASVTNECHY